MSVIDVDRLKKALPILEARWQEKDDAMLEWTAAVDAVADDVGINKVVLKKLVNAIKREKIEAEKASADELSALLDAMC